MSEGYGLVRAPGTFSRQTTLQVLIRVRPRHPPTTERLIASTARHARVRADVGFLTRSAQTAGFGRQSRYESCTRALAYWRRDLRAAGLVRSEERHETTRCPARLRCDRHGRGVRATRAHDPGADGLFPRDRLLYSESGR